VAAWAGAVGLSEDVAQSLLSNQVDGLALLELTADEIKELVPAMGPRKVFQREQQKLQHAAERAASGSEPGGGSVHAGTPAAATTDPRPQGKPSFMDTASTATPEDPLGTGDLVVAADDDDDDDDDDEWDLPGQLTIHTITSVNQGKRHYASLDVDLNGSLLDLKKRVHEVSGVPMVPDGAPLGAADEAVDEGLAADEAADEGLAAHTCGPGSCLCQVAKEVGAKAPPGFSHMVSVDTDCQICRQPLNNAGRDGTIGVVTGVCGCTLHTDCVERWLRGGPTPTVTTAATAVPDIQIFCRVDGRTITLEVSAEDKVESLRPKIQAKAGTPPYQQRIIYAGKQLEDGRSLSSYSIGKECTLHMLPRASGPVVSEPPITFGNSTCPGCAERWCYAKPEAAARTPAPIRVLLPGQDEAVTLDTDQCLPCSEIRSEIASSVPPSFVMMHRGQMLFDDGLVQPGCCVYLCHSSTHEVSFTVNVNISGQTERPLPVSVTSCDTIGTLKKKLQEKTLERCDKMQLRLAAAAEATEILADNSRLLSTVLDLRDPSQTPELIMTVVQDERLVLDLALLRADGTCFMLTSSAANDLRPLVDWGIQDSSVLYASWRKENVGSSVPLAFTDPGAGRLRVFSASAAWCPAVPQTPKGMSTMLSALYMLCDTLASKPDDADKLISHLAAVLPFPPALLGLRLLISKRSVTAAHQAALAQALYQLTREQLPATVPDSRVLEGSIVSLAWLVSGSHSDQLAPVSFKTESLTCQITHTRLTEPVIFTGLGPGAHFSRAEAVEHVVGAKKYCPGGSLRDARLDDMQADTERAVLLMAHPALFEATVLTEFAPNPSPQSTAVLWQDAKRLVTRCSWLRIISPKTLRNAPRPSMTLDNRGFVSLSVESGHSNAGEITLYSPLSDATTELSESELAKAVEAIDLEDTCDELAFDDAECDEAIIFVLDKSNSMDDSAGFKDKPDEPPAHEDDSVDIAIQRLINTESVELAYSQPPGNDVDLDDDTQNTLVDLQCDDTFEDQLSIVANMGTRSDKVAALTMILLEFCRESNVPENTAALIARQLHTFIRALTNRGATTTTTEAGVNPEFLCPITHAVMTDPVVTSDGQTYERAAIERWFAAGHQTSPLTSSQLESQTLVPNHCLRSMILDLQSSHVQQELPTQIRAEHVSTSPRGNSDRSSCVQVHYHQRHVNVAINERMSISTFQKLVRSKLGIPREQDFTLVAGADGHPQKRLTGCYFSPDDNMLLAAAGVTSASVISATDSRRYDTVEVKIDAGWRAKGFDDTIMACANESYRAILWRLLRLVVESGQGSHSTLSSLTPSKQHVWSTFRPGGDGVMYGTYHYGCCKSTSKSQEQIGNSNGGKIELVLERPPRNAGRSPSFMSRCLCVKQLFHALVNRTEAYAFDHYLGLVTFGTDVVTDSPLTPCFNDFKLMLDRVTPDGDTACYDALAEAASQLVAFDKARVAKGKPPVRKRIICLSDGQDTCSTISSFRAAKQLQDCGVLVDALMIGEVSASLAGIAKSTGGYAFHPTQLKHALKLCELETLLCADERPPSRPPLPLTTRSFQQFESQRLHPLDICDDDVIPPRKALPGTGQPVHSLEGALLGAFHTQASTVTPQATTFSVRDGQRRLMREMQSLLKTPHPSITVLPGEQDISYWQFVITGPDGTPYRYGTCRIHPPIVYLLLQMLMLSASQKRQLGLRYRLS
jgi:ubiquitin/uncharacterized protein YegL